jgi:hypothetical protein
MIQSNLQDLPNTSISIIISPHIGLSILKSLYPPPAPPSTHSLSETSTAGSSSARVTRSSSALNWKNGPKGVWFQPGAESDEIRAYVAEMGLGDRVICAGNHECILVEGDELLKSRKEGGGSRL